MRAPSDRAGPDGMTAEMSFLTLRFRNVSESNGLRILSCSRLLEPGGCLPLYFFDITNGGPHRDDTGTECADHAAMRRIARQTIPDIARDEIPKDGERRAFTIIVRDESNIPVYTAMLSYIGMDLSRRPDIAEENE